jgi:EmrB/QacA subfamily drug resistance transporter
MRLSPSMATPASVAIPELRRAQLELRTDPAEAPPLPHREARLIVVGVLLPLFLGALDNTILASALPTIGRDFDDFRGLPWLITVYLLASTACMPLYGKIADIHGRRFALRIAILAYMAGSLVCALAPSMLVLILGRALQGTGGSGLSSIGLTVLGDIAAPKERGRYSTYFAMTYTVAGACGPALGGFIAGQLHWSVIFWLNIPLGLMSLVITSWLLRRLPRHDRPHRLDVIGAMLIVAASVSLMLALNLGGRSYPWLSLPVILPFALAFVIGTFFLRRLLTTPEPLIPISILLDPLVRWAVVANSLGWASIIGLTIFLPMYLQSVMGLSPTGAGLSLMVLMVSHNIASALAGHILGRVNHYKLVPMCMMAIAIGAVTMLGWRADSMTLLSFEIILLLIGAGFGTLPPVTSVALQNAVALHQLGIAVGTMNFVRNLFSSMLVAVLGIVVLAVPPAMGPGEADQLAGALATAPAAFSRVFHLVAACLAAALVALSLMEERPLRTAAQKTT